jgi:hypothetical protein
VHAAQLPHKKNTKRKIKSKKEKKKASGMRLCTPGDGGPQAQAEAAGGRDSSDESAAGGWD